MFKSLLPPTLALVLGASSFAASVPLPRLIPADTLLVLAVEDVPALREAASASPFMRAWQDAQIQEWLAPLRERLDWDAFNDMARANTGRTPAEVAAWIEGGALLALHNLEKVNEPGTVPAFVLLADFGANAERMGEFLEEAMASRQERQNVRQEEETYAGVTVHVVLAESAATDPDENEEDVDDAEPKSDLPIVWAINDGVLIMAADKAQVFAILDAQLDGGAQQPLESAPRFQRVIDGAEPSELVLLLHVPPLVDLLQGGLEQTMQANPNAFAPAPRDLVTGLGLDALQDVVATWRTTPEETVVRYRICYTAPRGLLSLIAADTPSFPQPRWIPARWQNVASYRFDVGQFMPRLEAMILAISPVLGGMIEGVTGQMVQKTGVDPKRDVFACFGDEVVVAQHFSPGESADGSVVSNFEEVPQLFAVSLRDPATIERSVEKLVQSGGPGLAQAVKTRDYLGYRLNTYTPAVPPMPEGVTPPAPRSIHYAFAGGYAFVAVGPAGPVEEALQSLAAESSESFWTRADVRQAVAALPRDATSFQLQDTASTLGLVVDMVERLVGQQLTSAAMAAAAENEEESDEDSEDSALVWTNPEAKPTRELFGRYFGPTTSYTTMNDTGIEAVSVMATPQK